MASVVYKFYTIATHLDCLSFTTRNILITTEITSPITAIANNAAKAMFTPSMSSEIPSLLLPLEELLVTIKKTKAIT